MLKLLHIADLHLDSRFAGLSLSESAKRRADMRAVFKNALDFANAEGCKAVLISGDLFDSEYYTADTLDFLSECFAAMPKCRFIIAPGNHDPYNSTSPYRFASFPENVFVFKSEDISAFILDDIGLAVYGYAFTSSVYGKNPLDGFSATSDSLFNVLCAHTELDNPISSYAPIPVRALSFAGFDYAALGHIHTKEEIGRVGDTVYAYSGCIAGRDHSEHGEKGGVLVTLDTSGQGKTVNTKRVRFCPWIYKTVNVALENALTEESAMETITDRIRPYFLTRDIEHIIRLRLTGEVSYELEADDIRRSLAPFGVADVQNETVFSYSSLSLDEDFSLRGEFYRVLKPLLTSDDPSVRKNAVRALKYGLSALGGCDIEV
ncbi:MAG: DNA repair exonuclease [Clostridia bacterium]|nr:DNA repair exonuclease [Clostridia bacterium]